LSQRSPERFGHSPLSLVSTYGSTSDRRAYDAVVIGGGHNGLVAAAYLARAGL